jgi:hypothetical protein
MCLRRPLIRMEAMHATRKIWLEAAALVAAALLASMLAALALGQSPATPGSAPCSPSLSPGVPGTPPVVQGEPQGRTTPPDNLSNRLALSDGVICPPPSVDPDIKLPTPQGGRTPVIPPPGSPGGDPTIRPK